MTTKRKVLLLLLVLVLTLVSFLAVGCKRNKTDDPVKTEWPEAGVYYYDSGNDEYTLTLNVGDTFALIVKGQSSSGAYTLGSDGKLTLDFSAEGKADATATLENEVITLTLDNATMRFLKKVNYTVKFETDDGSEVADQTVVNGKTLAKPADPVKDDFIFVGWYSDSAFKTPFAFGTQPITADTTLYAQWAAKSENGSEYTVTLDANYDGASELGSLETKGGKVYDLPTLDRDGYTFHGWWISMDKDGDRLSYQYKDGMVLDANTTLYALWQENASGNKLSAPVVNVEAGSVSWADVAGARSYNVKVIDASGAEVLNADVSATTVNVPFASYAAGEYKIVVTALALSEENNAQTTRYYTNKALARVSLFTVYNGTLVFNAVPNAERYYVSVACGNPDHNHALVDNGTSTAFSFANCVMPKEGISFTVTAVADGYASSTSEVFVHKMLLGAVEGLTYDADNQTVTWNPVTDAAYYMVQVSCGSSAHNHGFVNNGASTSVSLKECAPVDGKVTVKVYPVTKGFASPDAATIECAKTALATPSGIALNGELLSWSTVEGATGYEVKVGGKTYTAEGNSFDLSAILDYVEGTEYAISVRALGTEASAWTEEVTAYYFELDEKLSYANGAVSWAPVIGADRYELQVNGGEVVTVENGASSAYVTLTKSGVNLVKVRFVSGNHVSDWATVEVFAYAITLDTRGGSSVEVQYKAIGDEVNLPSPTKTGYSFVQWYNAPGGPASNALAYTDTVFAENGAIVLYAHYSPNKIQIEYSYGVGGSADKTEDEVLYEQDYQLVVPTPDSVTSAFAGWYEAPNGMGTQYTDAKGYSLTEWTELEGKRLYAFWVDPTLSFTLTKVNGKDGYMVSAGDRIAVVDEITVPESFKGLPVLMVAGSAFKDCTNLKVVNLPATIENISAVDPFEGCTGLEAINVYGVEGATVRYWSEDGVLFFNGENGNSPAAVAMVPVAKTGSYTIPDGIVELGVEAFKNSKITRVVIPASVTRINKSAFEGCTNLTSVVFEAGEAALTIDARAFAGCAKLERIVLPARLAEINLTKYSISGTTVTVASANNAFDGCTSLTEINVVAANKNYKSVDGILYSADGKTLLYCPSVKAGDVTVPTGVQIIAPGAFIGANQITSVTLPNTLTYVGECAFFGLSQNLTSVTFKGANLGTGVTVGKYAFRDCVRLNTIELEAGSRLVALSEGAFYNCTALTGFEVPASMTSIGKEAFRGCTGITTVSFASNGAVLAFGEGAFYGCTGITRVDLPANISEMPGIFVGCSNLSEVTIPETSEYFTAKEGVLYDKAETEIVFFPMGKTGEYTVPATVKVINSGIFAGVTGLTKLELPTTLEVIGDEAFKSFRMSGNDAQFVFYGEPNTEARLVIGNRAFESSYIPSIALPSHTKSLGEYCFYNAYFYTAAGITLNEGLEDIEAYAFYATSSSYDYSTSSYATINIPGSVKVLGDFCFYNGRLFPILNEGLEVIGNHAFYQWSVSYSPFDFNIPASVTTIGDGAFKSNYYIRNVIFAEGSQLKTIGAYAFSSLGSNFTTITIPKSVTSIGAYAFKSCTYLSTVIFEEGGDEDLVLGAASIYYDFNYGNPRTELVSGHVFDACTSINNVSFPSRLVDMGSHTFYNTCSGYCSYYSYSALTVTFGENSRLQTIGEYAFYNSHLHSIEIPASVCNQAPVVNDEFGRSYDRLAIGAYAFGRENSTSYCTLIGVPGGITFAEGGSGDLTIGNNAFHKALFTTIELPARLAPYTSYTGEVISGLANGKGVFNAMPNLTGIDIVSGGDYYAVKEGVIYNADFTELIFCPAGVEGVITIPATVTKVNAEAFKDCTKITEIKFEAGEANVVIGNAAFAGCTSMTSITLPKNLADFSFGMIEGCTALQTIVADGVSVVYSDGGVIYSGDKSTLIYYPANREGTTYTVLPGTKIIAEKAFLNNAMLETVILPEGLIEIRDNAFNSATALLSIEIPNTVEVIGKNVFQYCGKLNVTFAEGGESALAIGDYAFGHTHFEKIELPERLVALGDYVFENNTDLNSISFGENSKLTTIGNYVFINTASLTEVTFPDSLVTMGSYNFASSSAINAGIKRVYFGNGLKTLGECNFENLQSLEYVYFGSGLETMGRSNFRLCSKLTKVEFASDCKLTVIPMGTFMNTGLTEIKIPASVREIESRNPNNYYSYGAFENCMSLTKVEFASGSVCTLIGSKAFYNCTALTEFEVPASVIQLGDEAFMYCTGLTSFTVPVTVTKLGHSIFKNCTALSNVVLNTKATELSQNMFEGCTALTSIALPDYVTSIGANCFLNSGVQEFIVPETHKTLTVVGGIIYTKDMTTLVACPPSFSATSITFPKELTEIGSAAFKGMTELKEIIFEEGGTAPLVIGDSAFYGCTGLTTLVLPERLTTIGDDAFNACKNLMYVELPSNLTSMGTYSFYECTKLLEVYNKSSMSESDIKQWGLAGYYAKNIFTPTSGERRLSVDENGYVTIYLEDVYVSWNVDNITGNFLLGYTGSETNLVLPEGIAAIYQNAFYQAGNFDSIVIPTGIIYCMSNAFSQCGTPLLLFKDSALPSTWDSYWNNDSCQTIFGWSGEDVTYSFVTELGGPVESMTSKYAITLPVLENQSDLFFAGWYNNPEFSGSAVSGSYYNAEKTTLYARWMTEEELLGGTDAAHAFELNQDTPTTVTVDTKGERIYLKFTITEAGTYYLWSTSDLGLDTYALLYDENMSQIGYGFDGYWDYSEWNNFGIQQSFEAGTYYIVVNIYDYASIETGSFNVNLSTTSPK